MVLPSVSTCSTFSTTDALVADDIVRIIATDENVWMLYRPWDDEGVTRFNKHTGEWTTIRSGRGTTELAVDKDYLWLAAPSDGLKRFHFASRTWTSFRDRNGLLHNHVGEHALPRVRRGQ